LDSAAVEDEARALNVEPVAKDYRTVDYLLAQLASLDAANWRGPALDSALSLLTRNRHAIGAAASVALISGIAELVGFLPPRSTALVLGPTLGILGMLLCMRLARQAARTRLSAVLLYAASFGFALETLLFLKAVLFRFL